VTFADRDVRPALEARREPDLVPADFEDEREPDDLELEPERAPEPDPREPERLPDARPPEEREPERDLLELALDVAMIHLRFSSDPQGSATHAASP
jgi:hypothetical protein